MVSRSLVADDSPYLMDLEAREEKSKTQMQFEVRYEAALGSHLKIAMARQGATLFLCQNTLATFHLRP
jgi:hypothetical protein